MKRLFLILLSLSLLLGCLAGCGGAQEAADEPPAAAEPPAETGDAAAGAEAEAPDFASAGAKYAPETLVGTAGGMKFRWAMYFGVLHQYANTIYAYYGLTDFSAELGEDYTMGDLVRDRAELDLRQIAMLYERAEALGLGLTEEDEAAITEEIAMYSTLYFSGDNDALFADLGVSEEYYRLQAGAALLYDKLLTHYFGENGSGLPDEDVAAWLEENGYLYAKHILFKTVDDSRQPLDEETVAEKRAQAEAVYEALRKADPAVLPELFDTMMETYSEDPGLAAYPDGYFFQKGTMVTEFYEAALALEEGGLSGIVESAGTGYHILYRPVLDPDAVFGVDSSYQPYTLRYHVAETLLENMLSEWLEETTFAYTPEFEDLDVAALFALGASD